jgi:hypothetical protein
VAEEAVVEGARRDLESWQDRAAAELERLDPFTEKLLRRHLGGASHKFKIKN